jgi:hypothetical protein
MSVLLAGEELQEMQVLKSENGNYCFALNYNGNLVFYRRVPKPSILLWCSHSDRSLNSHPFKLTLDYNGNLILYDAKKQKVWSSNTGYNLSKSQNFQLTIENDGNLLIKNGYDVIWQAKKEINI